MPKIKLSKIKVNSRFRKDFGEIKELAASIKTYGLLHPIVIDRDKNLIAGERRLRAVTELGWEEVEVRYLDDIDEITARKIEIEENIQRKNFTWQEEVKAKAELDRINRKLVEATPMESWNLRKTARELDQALSTVAQDIQLSEAMKKWPELAKEKNKTAAIAKMKILMERELRKALLEKVDLNLEGRAAEILVHADCIDFMSKMPEESVNLIVTDPPWGVDINESVAGQGAAEGFYDDEWEDISSLLVNVYYHLWRILTPNSHAYIAFAVEHLRWHITALQAAGFTVDPIPFIWNKMSKGAMMSPYRYASSYTAWLFCWKGPGQKELNKGAGQRNVYDAKRVPAEQRFHPAENPVELLAHFIENSSEPGDIVFDPFGGSGSTLEAALTTNRRALGTELDPVHYSKGLERLTKYLGGVTI